MILKVNIFKIDKNFLEKLIRNIKDLEPCIKVENNFVYFVNEV